MKSFMVHRFLLMCLHWLLSPGSYSTGFQFFLSDYQFLLNGFPGKRKHFSIDIFSWGIVKPHAVMWSFLCAFFFSSILNQALFCMWWKQNNANSCFCMGGRKICVKNCAGCGISLKCSNECCSKNAYSTMRFKLVNSNLNTRDWSVKIILQFLGNFILSILGKGIWMDLLIKVR